MASDRCCAGRAADELSPRLASRPTPLEPPPRSAGLVSSDRPSAVVYINRPAADGLIGEVLRQAGRGSEDRPNTVFPGAIQ